MAHNLATINGKTAMAFYGKTPWHGLGTELNEPATAAEAIAAAALDYNVELTPLVTPDGLAVPQRKAVVRADIARDRAKLGTKWRPAFQRPKHLVDGFLRCPQ